MAGKRKKRAGGARQEDPREAVQLGAGVGVAPPAAAPRDPLREELSRLIGDILFDVQELGLCLGWLECEDKANCELAKKVAALSRKAARILKLQRTLASPAGA